MSKVDFSAPETIEALTAALEAAGVDGLEITRPDQSLRIVVGGVARGDRLSLPSELRRKVVVFKAPMAGEFLRDLPSRIDTKPTERPADTLGFLRVGPLLLPLEVENSAHVGRYLVEPGTIVGFGDPIAEVEPE